MGVYFQANLQRNEKMWRLKITGKPTSPHQKVLQLNFAEVMWSDAGS
ncbi:MAG: hypothetical protein IJ599_00220 [Alphaproteobacteria bacterium]|nr:hypothetical protein [Alphaproteobacteria bacterium]